MVSFFRLKLSLCDLDFLSIFLVDNGYLILLLCVCLRDTLKKGFISTDVADSRC